jgi:hypothetical protein
MPTLTRIQLVVFKFVFGACCTIYVLTCARVILMQSGALGYAGR